jgi:hypothetical protein
LDSAVLNFEMKFLAFILLLTLAVAGCTTKSQAQREAQAAYLAGQNAALKRQLAAQANGVTIVGPVQNPQVPWVAGLTLAQAIATANYLGADAPKEIVITRRGESATLEPDVLLNGTSVPLEPGDVIELR